MGIQKIRCEGKTWQIFNYSRTQLRGKPTITFTMNWKQFLYSDNSTKHVTLETQDIMCPQHMCPRHILNNNNYKTRDKDKEYKVINIASQMESHRPLTPPQLFFWLSLMLRFQKSCDYWLVDIFYSRGVLVFMTFCILTSSCSIFGHWFQMSLLPLLLSWYWVGGDGVTLVAS